jgi:ABC-2 type transport system permease protein
VSTILGAFTATLRAAFRDPALVVLLIVAPLFYSLLYPQPYIAQRLDRVPVAVVDEDGTALSRRITRYVAATPELDLTGRFAQEQSALDAMGAGTIEGALLIPHGLERAVSSGRQGSAAALGNGAYFLLNKTVLSGFAGAAGAAGSEAALHARLESGEPPAEARVVVAPIAFDLHRLFNPQEGYANYVVPAVAVLIIHQTLFLGIGTFLGTRRERSSAGLAYPPSQFLGELLAFSAIGIGGMLYYEGLVMSFYDFPRGGNPLGTLCFSVLFAFATVLFSMTLGSFFDRRERAMQMWVFTSPLLLFLSGYSWPPQSLPALLRTARWFIPATPGILGFTQLAQMGARWDEIGPEVLALSATIALLAVPAWLCVRGSLSARR